MEMARGCVLAVSFLTEAVRAEISRARARACDLVIIILLADCRKRAETRGIEKHGNYEER